MAKIYRSMKKANDGKPVVDDSGKGLGVRGVPVNGKIDVDLDQDGNVVLNDKGMSVAPAWRLLPYYLVPMHLAGKFPGARGKNLHCFTMGDGPFEDGPVAEGLDLKRDRPEHGNVVPRASVRLDQFQTDLANTRDRWVEDEA